MKTCCLFLLVFVAVCTKINRVVAKALRNEQNVGSVLFEKTDCGKHCWTSEEFTVLNSRRMFQDVLPKVKVINYQNDQYIAHLMDYFHICLESVRKLSIGKTKHLMLKALADTMGGYLHVYILPLTRHSYYAGNIKYRNAKRLFELFDELKNFLRTNGVGWLKPNQDIKHVITPPIVIAPLKSSLACNGLITLPAHSRPYDNRELQSFTFKKKRHVSRHKRSRSYKPEESSIMIPLPFLDNDAEPNSIALPFKVNSLQSLYTEKSSFALVKYYVASVKCISSKSKAKADLDNFSKELYNWLQQSVRKRLSDDKWYPAFGGVLRVIISLEESGLGGEMSGGKGGTYQVMPKLGSEFPGQTDEGTAGPLYKGDAENQNTVMFGTTELVMIAVVSALLVWLLVGLTLVCYRFLTRRSDDYSPCESPNAPVAVLYENSEYCQPDTCSRRKSRRVYSNKMRNWWKAKFGKCQGDCDNRNQDEERCLAAISYSSKDTVSNTSKMCHRKRYNKSIDAVPSPGNRRTYRTKTCYRSSDASSSNTDVPSKTR